MTATMFHAQAYMFFDGLDRDGLQASDFCLADMVNFVQDEHLLASGGQRVNGLHQVIQGLTRTSMLLGSGGRAYLVLGAGVRLLMAASTLVATIVIDCQVVQDTA